jgi:hypothetical protein
MKRIYMSWGFSFQLLPGEDVIDDSTKRQNDIIKPAYSVFLTNKRAVFRFDGLGSSLTKSLFYNEILDAKPAKRLFINYLLVKAKDKEYLLNTSEPEYWSEKIRSVKENIDKFPEGIKERKSVSYERKKVDILDMLITLRKNSLLTEEEFEEKVRLLDSLNL